MGDSRSKGCGIAGRKLAFTSKAQFNASPLVGKAYTALLDL
jgi:hypothetical protein